MDIDPRLRTQGPHSHNRSDVRHPTTATTGATWTQTAYPDPPTLNLGHGHGHGVSHSQGPGSLGTVYARINTPASASTPHQNDDHDHDHDHDHDPDDPKRPRACEACRQLKVRCEPDPNAGPGGGGGCKRCAKTGRQCVVTVPSRKRQKKTDSRVAELERKIDALTSSLVTGQGQGFTQGPGHGAGFVSQQDGSGAGVGSTRRWIGAKQSEHSGSGFESPGTKRRLNGEVKEEKSTPGPGPSMLPAMLYPNRSNPHTKQWRAPSGAQETGSGIESGGDGGFVDAIDRGLVSLEAASQAFDYYVTEMTPQLPIVTFPPGTQIHDIRRSKPVLFHTILAVAIGPIQPDIQVSLFDEFWKILAERMVVKGDKSLELVQAMVLTSTWYLPPDRYEELKFYQLINMAITLAIDIGMSRRTKTARKPFNIMRDWVGKKAFSLDLDSPETRRTWLGCYYLSVQVASALRRVPLIRWHPYMDECIEILETSPDALPSDKALIRWTRLAQLTEEVGFHFSCDEPDSNATFSDPKVQYTLRVLEKQLEKWRRETPAELYSLTMKQTDYLLNTYIHEPTMHIDSTTDQKLTDTDHPSPTSTAYITALSTCLTCVHQSLDIVLSMPTRDLLSLPTYVLARASYAVVALIRIYAIVTGPETQISQVIDPSSLKAEWYLDRVVEHYKTASDLPGGRTLGKFAVILDLLRIWFVKQKDQNPELKEALAGVGGGNGEIETVRGVSHCEGLHLLSEVATGKKSRGEAEQMVHGGGGEAMQPPTSVDSLVSQPLPAGTTDHQQQQPQQQQPWMQYPYQSSYSTNPTTTATTTYQDNPTTNTQIFVPELGVQLGASAGFDSDLLAWGDMNMLGDGFFNFPFAADGNMFW